MIEICKHEECTGCSACVNICGHNAIHFSEDSTGFVYPIINQTLCVDCGLCARVCPNNNAPEFHAVKNSLASCSKEPIIQLNSTSGGLATVFAKSFLNLGGIVYGCSGDGPIHAKHIRVSDIELLNSIAGSKYVQSDMHDIYRQLRNDLMHGSKVLFIGTPCQVAGAINFVGDRFRDNLYTIDFICHGVPPQRILNDTLRAIFSDNIPHNLQLKFRIKTPNRQNNKVSDTPFFIQPTIRNTALKYRTLYGLFAFIDDKMVFGETFPDSAYITGFLSGLFYRESCYICRYAQTKRVSDITLGDFHFACSSETIDGDNMLLSKCLINSAKGKELFDHNSSNLNSVEIDWQSLIKEGGQLTSPMNKNPLRDQFLSLYKSAGLSEAFNLLKPEQKKIKQHLFKNRVRDFLYSTSVFRIIIHKIKKCRKE